MTTQTDAPEPKKTTSRKKKTDTVVAAVSAVAETAATVSEAPKKSAPKKTAAPKEGAAPKKEAAAKKATPKKKTEAVPAAAIDPAVFQAHVEHTAYLIAASEGFPEGRSLDHWVQAEERVNSLLAEGKLPPA